MKIKKTYLLGACLLCSVAVTAQDASVHPRPQQMVTKGKYLELPASYRLNGEAEANVHAVNALKTLLNNKEKDPKGLQIYIGEKGDKAIRKFARQIPDEAEGYYLLIDNKQIVVAGHDERGTFYGLQTLAQLLKDNRLPETEIKDYPSVRFRGVVEGFYGTPWSHEARLRQLKFYGENKMNTYIYGPKDDPYHSSPNWRLPYPEKEARQLQELVKVANENEVNFVWAIHPGQDIKWNPEDRNLLLAKFEKMYELGVRAFAVFFDDISGEGTNPEKQAELLNYIDEQFVKAKPDVKPLVMCPTEYNKSWSNPKGNYLTTLGKKLNPSIQIMWTGDRVVSDITKDGIGWINERIKRPAYIWWNFPVSDYVRDHLLLGPVYGNDTTIAGQMAGFVTNPMEHAEASKIAIYGVAGYAWNPAKYDSRRTWKEAMRTLMPDAASELEFFAENNSDLGPNGHKYRREESETLQPLAERFEKSYEQGTYSPEDFTALEEYFAQMTEAADVLAADKENTPLVKEMMPWLRQFKLLGETGKEVLAMAKAYKEEDQSLFMRKYKHVKALQLLMFDIDQTYNQNPYQPGIKTATKVVKPFIDRTFATVTERYNNRYGMQLDATTDYMPHKLVSDVEQIKNLPLQIKTNRILISPSNEVVKWPADASLTIEFDNAYPGESVEFDFGKPGITQWAQLEISTDGNHWEKAGLEQDKNRVVSALRKASVKAIRLTNTGPDEQQIYLRRFVVTIEK